MNCIYWVKVALLFISPLAVAAQNQTVQKWEKAFEALRRRNHNDAQKRLEISPSRHKEEYNPYRDGFDYFESTRTSKDKGVSHEDSHEGRSNERYREPPYHSKESSHEERDLENHVSHPQKHSHRDHDYSDEEYERDHRNSPHRFPEKDEYRPHSYSHSASGEIHSKPPSEPLRFRKTSRYSPPHLHSHEPLIPPEFRADSSYYHPPYQPRIYLPYRPSHRYKERTTAPKPKMPYGSKMQDVHSKHHYDSDYFEPSVKAKYRHYSKLSKPEYASSSYFIGSQRSKYPGYRPHYSYTDNDRGYRSSYDYPDSHSAFPTEHHSTPEDFERKPDPYYASAAYAKDKHFGVDPLKKDFTIPLNVSVEKFSRPDPFDFPTDKYSSPHNSAPKLNTFSPSYGPSGFPKQKYSPRESYSNSFDASDPRFKYPNRPYGSGPKDERDPYLVSGSNAEGRSPQGLVLSGSSPVGKGWPLSIRPELGRSFYFYTYGSPLENKGSPPPLQSNKTNQLNVSNKMGKHHGSKIPQPSENNTVLALPPLHAENRIRAPLCALSENTTFCLYDAQYPYASISKAISRHREKLEELLLEIPENEAERANLTGSNQSSCQMRIRYGVLMRAVNSEGRWKIIAKLPQNYDSRNYSQVVRLEQCSAPGSSCDPSKPNSSGKCLQGHSIRTLLSWSPELGLHLDTFNLPSACICHLERNTNTQLNQRNQQSQHKMRKLRTG